ncbi:histidine kinase [Microbacterium sp. SS28]|uniref:sensor histidine kinase n=1 Tax=Microbacterium sp. SS28 TaxID=2919948 RepID=UPI001FAA67F4|nr:histidine kinase [Microbacterium sp. SS28]
MRRRSWTVRAIMPAIYFAVAVLLALVSLEPRFATPLWSTVALGAAGLAALATRARYPLPALGGALVVAVFSLAVGTGAETIVVAIVLYGIAVGCRGFVAWACFAVALAFGALGAWVFTARLANGPSLWGSPPVNPRDVTADWIFAFAVFAVALLVTTLLGTSAGQRQRHVRTLLERAEQLAHERDQQAEIAAARERERIAREMHDVIAHSLSVMIAISDGAHAAADERPDEAKVAIARVSETGRRTLGEVRRLLGGVRRVPEGSGSVYSPQPDATQLPALVEQFTTAGLPVRMTVTGSPTDDPAVGLTVYRIVQESLTNVLRHARDVTAVLVALTWTPEEVAILVEDSASPAAAAQNAGRGLVGMAERVAMFDGSVESSPRAGGGWRVKAHLRWGDR